jgi:hypothetical protein
MKNCARIIATLLVTVSLVPLAAHTTLPGVSGEKVSASSQPSPREREAAA